MAKSHSFTVYLLKTDFSPEKSLEDGHGLKHITDAESVADTDFLYLHDAGSTQPWWKQYFGIKQPLLQSLKGAILFHSYDDRWLVFTFGNVRTKLKSESFVHDFGKRVCLNAIDPNRLKSTDTLSPTEAQKRRTQMPGDTDLLNFGFDGETTILRGLTGRTTEAYADIIKTVTGADSVKVRATYAADELDDFSATLMDLYNSKDFESAFPEIANVQEVRDPETLSDLNEKLVLALRAKSNQIQLAYPGIVNYSDDLFIKFRGEGRSASYDDVSAANYYEYLEKRDFNLNNLTTDVLKRHKIQIANESGWGDESESIQKAIVWDVTTGSKTYHLAEGTWYEVDADYVQRLESYIDSHIQPWTHIHYEHESENHFNNDLSDKLNAICLDTKDIRAKGQSQVEPCDVFDHNGGNIFYHVKRSTVASGLSHLFAQGENSYQLLLNEETSRQKFKALIEPKLGAQLSEDVVEQICDGTLRVIFVITTHKDVGLGAKALPLFSKISAFRTLKDLHTFRVNTHICFVPDKS